MCRTQLPASKTVVGLLQGATQSFFIYTLFLVWNEMFLSKFYIVRKQSSSSLQFMFEAEDRSVAVKLFLFKLFRPHEAKIEL